MQAFTAYFDPPTLFSAKTMKTKLHKSLEITNPKIYLQKLIIAKPYVQQ